MFQPNSPLPHSPRRVAVQAASLAFAVALLAPSQPLSGSHVSAEARQPPVVGDPVEPGVWRLHGTDPGAPAADLAALRKLIGNAGVVGLGETMHTSGGFYELKHRVIRHLVENAGFRVVAWETPWLGAERLSRYVQECGESAEAAMSTIFPVWQGAETRDLVQWMCDWNRDHPKAKDRVHFLGFDIQDVYGEARADAAALRALLEKAGVGAGSPLHEDLSLCDGVTVSHPIGEIPEEDHARCSAALAGIDALFQRSAAAITRRSSKAELARARIHLASLRAWEGETFLWNRDVFAAVSARDAGMAASLIGFRHLFHPKAKMIVWAHNAHLAEANTDLESPGWVAMGSYLAKTWGKNYYTVALAAFETEIDWPGMGCGLRRNIGTEESLERRLHEIGTGDLIVDLDLRTLSPALRADASQWVGIQRQVARRDYDALLYLERSPRMQPLAYPSCRR